MAPAPRRPRKRQRARESFADVVDERQPATEGEDDGLSVPDGVLPVNAYADKIASAMTDNDVLLLIGETGSGKTTQLPQQIIHADADARVVVTQPRRVAAVAVGTRVAHEQGTEVGELVGYAVRFDDRSGPDTRIRYVTDGVMLREALSADGLSRYSHVVVDEVHERSVNTDIVLGVVQRSLIASRRANSPPPFKLVVMSATTDAEKLQTFFADLSVSLLRVPGRLHPVEMLTTNEPVSDIIDGAATAAMQIHVDYGFPGDILVFLPGQDEIVSAIELLRERMKRYLPADMHRTLHIHALYGALDHADQMLAIEPLPPSLRSSRRKVIFATNVAETSITIPGVRYVVDAGLAKTRVSHAAKGVHADVLRLAPISRAQAEQRAGRAGRESAGFVFRLYTGPMFESLPAFPTPEILRGDAAGALLAVAALGGDSSGDSLRSFPFVDRPPKRAQERALVTLVQLGALADDMRLTETGRLMAGIPAPPQLARALLEAARLGCVDAMAGAAAALSVDGAVFLSPAARRDAARAAHRRFASPHGDVLALARALDAFAAAGGDAARRELCRDHFLGYRSLAAALNVREQLRGLLSRPDVVRWAAGGRVGDGGMDVLTAAAAREAVADADADELVLRCLVAGFFQNAARRTADGKYRLLAAGNGAGATVDIHPSSTLRGRRGKGPDIVVFNEFVVTTKPYLRNVVRVRAEWLWHHSNGFFTRRGAVA